MAVAQSIEFACGLKATELVIALDDYFKVLSLSDTWYKSKAVDVSLIMTES
jgi:hypothetical protein